MSDKRAAQKDYHFTYKTTCLTTGRFYLGLHSTDDLNDNYLGSGRRLISSVKKHGRENHVRVILEEFDTRAAASNAEKKLITPELRKDPLCLNCGPGGLGTIDRPATSEETRAKLSAASKGYIRTKEWRENMSKGNKGLKRSDETRANIKAAMLDPELRISLNKKLKEANARPEVIAKRKAAWVIRKLQTISEKSI